MTTFSLTFDTHEAVKRLVSGGMSQTEAVTETIKSLDVSHLATRQDLKELEHRLTIKMGAIVMAVFAFFEMMDRFF